MGMSIHYGHEGEIPVEKYGSVQFNRCCLQIASREMTRRAGANPASGRLSLGKSRW